MFGGRRASGPAVRRDRPQPSLDAPVGSPDGRSPAALSIMLASLCYITVSSPSGGAGGRWSTSFSAFKTNRASGQPPVIPRRSGWPSRRKVTNRTVESASIARCGDRSIPASFSRRPSRCFAPAAPTPQQKCEPSLAIHSDDRSAACQHILELAEPALHHRSVPCTAPRRRARPRLFSLVTITYLPRSLFAAQLDFALRED